jgi:sugar phosphate isomerase/epimerase
MSKPIGLQLYSLRDALANDFEGVIRRVADIGYIGVEPFGGVFAKTPPQDAVRLFNELGLQVPASHAPVPLGDDKQKALDMMAALHSTRLIIPWLPPEEFATVDAIKRTCAMLNEANAVARANGLELLYHNHWQEYEPVNGRRAYQVMVEHLDLTINFEIDTYWVKTAGCDPLAVIQELGARVPLLHIKDGPTGRDLPMTAVGDGVMDFETLIPAAENTAEWMIVEQDNGAADMLASVEKSYRYLTSKGLARGNKN